VELLENAPYSEIVRRLGEASIGLNTMQDEHFGINVVEFMVRPLPFLYGCVGADGRLLD
jgi:alpha-1,2-mannosyltransferase